MCDICDSEKLDTYLMNGDRPSFDQKLYRIFKDRAVVVKLCYLHSIELFCKGEIKFLQSHLPFARKIAQRQSVTL